MMLTSDEKAADYRRTVESHEGGPIRPHSDALYPKVHVVNGGREVWIAFRPNEQECMSRTQAHDLHEQLREKLGLKPCGPSGSIKHVSHGHAPRDV